MTICPAARTEPSRTGIRGRGGAPNRKEAEMKELEALDRVLEDCDKCYDPHVVFMTKLTAIRGFFAAAAPALIEGASKRLCKVLAEDGRES